VTSVPVPSPLPPATFDDIVNPEVPRIALATPGAWQEWLGELSGHMAWVGEDMVSETNFMARAEPGTVTAGYVKSAATRDGLAVWERVT